MWSLNSPPLKPTPAGDLPVTEVLYYYDGPQVFVSRFGFLDTICIKIDEVGTDELFLVSSVSSERLAALKKGQLSLRGAMSRRDYFIVQTGHRMTIENIWQVNDFELPPYILPEAGVGLHVHFGKVVDTLEQSSAFFALRFAGETLKAGQMAFSRFKTLVDDTYELARKAFAPPSISTRQSLFDFNITEPTFGSLIIAIQEPTIDGDGLRKIRKSMESIDQLTPDIVRAEMDFRRKTFFAGVEEVVELTSRSDLSYEQASQHFFTLDQINDVVPTEKNTLNSVEFSANSGGFTGSIVVDDKLGERLRNAHRLAEFESISVSGSVVEQNGESSTFILKNASGRQMTCQVQSNIFKKMSELGQLKYGTRLRVRGRIKKRKRRDFVTVDEYTPILDQLD